MKPDTAGEILDTMQELIQARGFNAISYQDVADRVGIRKASIHYHFPTKEKLAAAVVRRYTDEVAEMIDRELVADPNPVKVWTRAFRGTLHSDERMCPCAVLGAASLDLPPEVAAEVKHFFKMCLDKLAASLG